MNSSLWKNLIYILVFLAIAILGYNFWSQDSQNTGEEEALEEPGRMSHSKKAFGLDFEIIYLDPKGRDFKSSIDSLFWKIEGLADASSSSSEIGRLNYNDTLISPSQDLIRLLKEAEKWHLNSGGAFEVTDTPLQQAWRFSNSGAVLMDTLGVEHARRWVGLAKINRTDSLILKPFEVKVDFSKMISGIALDQLAQFLVSKGIENFHLKLGKTELTKGLNSKGELWKSQVKYLEDSTGKSTMGEIALLNKSISHAGNPDEFYWKDSTKVSFTLDPRTGLPVNHGLLAITVVAEEGKTADALAEQLMVMGKTEAIRMDSARNDLQMILIFSEKGGKIKQHISPDLRKYLAFPVGN
ncbi:FAD:protein FMN transferase [Algoriphagus mannitolivorans]|uniref:FAD:protein FMN transferase n=1 Tax=Algoriphagus mannitolivorans TaxID=226504 RepID=UPI000409597A|nr:FAD:protein FMN transferase [Algoriphagus mannitolivorans]